MVNNNEIGQKLRTQSNHSKPTRETPPKSHQAIAAEAKAANKRLPEPISLVISSKIPATNTGIAATNNAGQNQFKVVLSGLPKTSKPAKVPANTAKPPIRGVERACEA